MSLHPTTPPHPRGPTVLRTHVQLIAVVCALGVYADEAQGQRLNIRQYSDIGGTPIGQVYAIHQDHQGYVWFATNAGLARYDGHRLHVVTAEDGLASNSVVLVDGFPEGPLVAATQAGLCLVGAGPITCVGRAEGLVGGQVHDLLLQDDGSIWVATDQGLSVVDATGAVRSHTTADGLPGASVLSLARDGDGTVWAAMSGGLARFTGTAWQAAGPPPTGPPAVVEASPDGLYAGGNGGLSLLRDGRWEVVPLGPDPGRIRVVRRGPDGTLWVGGLRTLHRVSGSDLRRFTAENGLPTQDMWDMNVDREGNVWLGSDEGLFKVVPGPFDAFTQAQGLPHSFVRALVETDDGRLWFGTREGLALRSGSGMVEVPFAAEAPDPRIYSLAEAPRGGLLVGTPGGLVHRDPSGLLQTYDTTNGLPHDFVISLLAEGDDKVWIGSFGGLRLWRDGALEPPPHPETGTVDVLSLAMDGKGRLWIGRYAGGVVVVDADSLIHMDASSGLSDQAIWSMAADPSGGMWVGTNGEGAFHVSDDGIRRLTSDDGLADDFVWQVGVDRRGAVWFYTASGLNRLQDGVVHYYGAADGLTDLEGAAAAFVEDREGRLWFGAGRGVFRYDPTLDRRHPAPPGVRFEGVTEGGSPVPADRLVMGPRATSIVFDFSIPTYRDEDGMRLRYRFAGSGEDWSPPLADPVVSFARLGHGDYRLEVVAESDRGMRSSQVLTVPFTVLPSWWQTWWFRGLVVLLVAGALTSVPLIRSHHLKGEQERLEALVHQRTEELERKTLDLQGEIEERERSEQARELLQSQLWEAQKMEVVGRLAGGVAHDFNNLLAVVLGHADLLMEEAPEDSEFRAGLGEIRASANRGAKLVSRLLAFSQKQIGRKERLDLAEALTDSLSVLHRLVDGHLDFHTAVPTEPLWVVGDRGQLNQVLMNLALNAQDAMPEGGRLEVALASEHLTEAVRSVPSSPVPPGRYAVLTVADTGEGMDAETLSRAFEPFFTTRPVGEGSGLGLSTVYGIVEMHEGHLQVRSAPGEGTRFEIYLPLAADPV